MASTKVKATQAPTGHKAKTKAATRMPPPPLVVDLNGPGMTPMLRAGLGGLAAALYSIALEGNPRAKWPSPVRLGPGTATVEPRRVVLDWGGDEPAATLRELFEKSFRIRKPEGVIELWGTRRSGRAFDIATATALQSALKKTFLQHGKTTEKAGESRAVAAEIDGAAIQVLVQPYTGFVHQTGADKVLEALRLGSIDLPGWAYPGAVGRHNAYNRDTDCRYAPAHALAALFAITGCLSLEIPRVGGALLVLEPADLVAFARTRALLSPAKVQDVFVASAGDAVLAVELAIRVAESAGRSGLRQAHAVTFKTLPWAKQQRTRSATLTAGHYDEATVAQYRAIVRSLPARIVRRDAAAKKVPADEAGYYPVMSPLRAFVADNLARGQRWFRDFAIARTADDDARFIHYYWERDGVGALHGEDRKGLSDMLEHLEQAELALVKSVHAALAQRFGRIAEESAGSTVAMRKRWDNERERLRLAFAGAKTHEQVRGALADMWSRAGSNKVLRASWEQVLPLLREDRWRTARDLALVALASYGRADSGDADAAADADATDAT